MSLNTPRGSLLSSVLGAASSSRVNLLGAVSWNSSVTSWNGFPLRGSQQVFAKCIAEGFGRPVSPFFETNGYVCELVETNQRVLERRLLANFLPLSQTGPSYLGDRTGTPRKQGTRSMVTGMSAGSLDQQCKQVRGEARYCRRKATARRNIRP